MITLQTQKYWPLLTARLVEGRLRTVQFFPISKQNKYLSLAEKINKTCECHLKSNNIFFTIQKLDEIKKNIFSMSIMITNFFDSL
jgi:hypothetical protein